MIKHRDSHLDHGLNAAQVDYIIGRFAERTAFFVETIELPSWMGTVPCGLYGPAMGDRVIGPGLVTYAARGGRRYNSRLIDAPTRPTSTITVIGGPHDGNDCVLYTAFGGPPTPKEPTDPTLKESERDESAVFWSVHALANTDGQRP